jgi:hypothetical protein
VTVAAGSPRLLAAVCAGLAVSAVALWGASAAVWHRTAVAGRAPEGLTGAQVAPSLTGVALLALAGVAALVATGGVLRRMVGVLLGAAGAVVAVVAARALVVPPSGTDPTVAPLLAVGGGVLLLAVGLSVLVGEPRLARFGARYSGAATRRPEVDPDRAAWQDLDAGRDPTADAPEGRVDDPGDGHRSGPV